MLFSVFLKFVVVNVMSAEKGGTFSFESKV